MFSEDSEKFIGLEKNENVCLAIYDKYDGFVNLKSLQVMGKAGISNEPYLCATGKNRSTIFRLKKDGYSIRQTLRFQ